MIDWEKLADTINDHFGEPYLPKGMVKAWVNENGFHLRIGRRDIALEEDGTVWASGTQVACARGEQRRNNKVETFVQPTELAAEAVSTKLRAEG